MKNELVSLLVLAYNEEESIEDIINNNIEKFYEIIVVNDKSTDKTLLKLIAIKKNYSNLKFINNDKNFGPGKSMQIGIDYFLQSKAEYLVKIDGDGQFQDEDISTLLDLVYSENVDFVKGDRFWHSGIIGEIPIIRYFGNSFASFLLKTTSGSWKVNDPLNGLFLFSRRSLNKFTIPKLFHRYGYPFYVNNFMLQKLMTEDISFIQFNNTISYENHKSNLKALTLLIKLLVFSVKNIFTKFKLKLKISYLQISAVLDLFNFFVFGLILWSIFRFSLIRYFAKAGDQSNWFIIFLIFIFVFFINLTMSQYIQSKFLSKKIKIMKK